MPESDERLSQIISQFGPELLQEWLSSLLTYASPPCATPC